MCRQRYFWTEGLPDNPIDFSYILRIPASWDVDEVRAGTDPTDSGSQFKITGFAEATGNSIKGMSGAGKSYQLQRASAHGRTYTVWCAGDLIERFTVLESGIFSTPPVNVYNAFSTNAAAFIESPWMNRARSEGQAEMSVQYSIWTQETPVLYTNVFLKSSPGIVAIR